MLAERTVKHSDVSKGFNAMIEPRTHETRYRVDVRKLKVPLVLRDRVIQAQTLWRQDSCQALECSDGRFTLFPSSSLAPSLYVSRTSAGLFSLNDPCDDSHR